MRSVPHHLLLRTKNPFNTHTHAHKLTFSLSLTHRHTHTHTHTHTNSGSCSEINHGLLRPSSCGEAVRRWCSLAGLDELYFSSRGHHRHRNIDELHKKPVTYTFLN